MNPAPIINKKSVKSALPLRQAQKQEKRLKGKGGRRPLKNYLGKVVTLSPPKSTLEKSKTADVPANVSVDELLCAIEKAGLTGMSGNGFPIHQKITSFLAAKPGNRILLINAVECDPALVHDEWLLHNRYAEIRQAIHHLKQTLSLTGVVLAIKDKRIRPNDACTIATVPPRYPMGEEHFLIRQALGIPIESDTIPAEQGILVLNIQRSNR